MSFDDDAFDRFRARTEFDELARVTNAMSARLLTCALEAGGNKVNGGPAEEFEELQNHALAMVRDLYRTTALSNPASAAGLCAVALFQAEFALYADKVPGGTEDEHAEAFHFLISLSAAWMVQQLKQEAEKGDDLRRRGA